MYKRITGFLLVGAIVVLLSVGLMGTEELAADQTLYIAPTSAPDLITTDPHKSTGDRVVPDLVFNGLLRYKPGTTTELEPELATSIPEPTIVNGKQLWTFHLREGVMTHPFPGYPEGYELTAEDVVYSFTRAANPELSAFSGEYKGMSFEAVDKYTVNILVDDPVGPMLFLPKVAAYAGGFIVPEKAAEQLGADFAMNPVGTGPFMFEAHYPGEKLVLVRNTNYFRGVPYLEKIELIFMPESGSRELALLAGQIDVALVDYSQETVDRLQGNGIPVKIFGPGSSMVLYLNTTLEPLDSIAVRKAILYALDREDNLQYYGSVAAPLYSQANPPEVMTGGLSRQEVIDAGLDYIVTTDLVKAKELLKDAGYPDGLTLEICTTNMSSYLPNMEIARNQLGKIGITLKLNVVDHATFHETIRQNQFPLVPYSAGRQNADAYLTQFWHSKSRVIVGESPVTNFSQYTEVDDLIEQARVEIDSEKQEELWKEAQIKILSDAAMYPIQYLRRVYAVQDYVDLGYEELKGSWNLYATITEETKILKH